MMSSIYTVGVSCKHKYIVEQNVPATGNAYTIVNGLAIKS